MILGTFNVWRNKEKYLMGRLFVHDLSNYNYVNSHKIPKTFTIMSNWRHFGKSGHTAAETDASLASHVTRTKYDIHIE